MNVTASVEYSNSSQDALVFMSSTESDLIENTALINATTSEDEEVNREDIAGDTYVKLSP